MKDFMWSYFWGTVIIACEVLKWIAAFKMTQYISWLKGVIK
jgi:hypothetical protein